MTPSILVSTITCPSCGHSERLDMPTDACLFFHECAGCHTLLRPKAGDCCVFCSYGSVPCPPVQVAGRDGGCCPPTAPRAGGPSDATALIRDAAPPHAPPA